MDPLILIGGAILIIVIASVLLSMSGSDSAPVASSVSSTSDINRAGLSPVVRKNGIRLRRQRRDGQVYDPMDDIFDDLLYLDVLDLLDVAIFDDEELYPDEYEVIAPLVEEDGTYLTDEEAVVAIEADDPFNEPTVEEPVNVPAEAIGNDTTEVLEPADDVIIGEAIQAEAEPVVPSVVSTPEPDSALLVDTVSRPEPAPVYHAPEPTYESSSSSSGSESSCGGGGGDD